MLLRHQIIFFVICTTYTAAGFHASCCVFGVWVSSSGSILGFHWFSNRLQCLSYPIFRPCFPNIFVFLLYDTYTRQGRKRLWTERTQRRHLARCTELNWTDFRGKLVPNELNRTELTLNQFELWTGIPCRSARSIRNRTDFCMDTFSSIL